MFHVIITDKDVGEPIKPLHYPTTRYAARGIILDKDLNIALLNKVLKNEFKLPGGGIENDESPKEAFLRECLEETGCQISIIDQLGIIEEHKSKDNFKQISYAFLGKVDKDLGYQNLTEKEIDEGAKVFWANLDEAIKLIKHSYNNIVGSSYESVYQSKFIIFRDLYILNAYKNETKQYK